jgi:hypothetical protein
MEKPKENINLGSLSNAELLALAMEKCKGKVLFAKQIEDAKRYLKNAKIMVK